ncbi:MAG: metallophosphoesterase [Paenibacillaceae bacterium]
MKGRSILTRTLVISDIHGCYDAWIALLKKVHFKSKEDRLILLGGIMWIVNLSFLVLNVS